MSAPLTLSARLKLQTHDQHTRAERHPVQHALVGGRTSAPEYARYLEQMHRAHQGFERSLRTAAARDPALAALVREHHYRVPQLLVDLAYFGADPDAAPSEATSRFTVWTGDLAATRPTALIGVLYVLEGSTNGGRFIARALRRCLGLTGAEGTAFFDPHGEAQAERWGDFKGTLDGLELDAATVDAVVAAASATFVAIVDIMDHLPRPEALEPVGSHG